MSKKITWTTDERLQCLNCDTIYNLSLSGTAVAVEEDPCPGCGEYGTSIDIVEEVSR